MPTPDPQPRAVHVDALDRVPLAHGFWRPVRRPFGITAFGVNAYSADGAGDALIEPHDEASPGSGRHEELYLVVAGVASFVVGEERMHAPAGTLVFVPPGVHREATAAAPDTTVVVVGGRPGDGLPVSPFEYWYAAGPAYDAGDFDRAIEILSEGLEEWPEHPRVHYNLACFHARAGHRDEAIHHLRFAAERDPVVLEFAAERRGPRRDPRRPGVPAPVAVTRAGRPAARRRPSGARMCGPYSIPASARRRSADRPLEVGERHRRLLGLGELDLQALGLVVAPGAERVAQPDGKLGVEVGDAEHGARPTRRGATAASSAPSPTSRSEVVAAGRRAARRRRRRAARRRRACCP